MDDLHRRALVRGVITFLVVAIVGSIFVAAIGGGDSSSATPPSEPPSLSASVAVPEPQTWLAWVPGGLPSGFGDLLGGVPEVTATTTAAADIAWMTASFDANGDPVDQPMPPMMVPIDVSAVDPTFAAFVPQPERQLVQNLRSEEVILSETEAQLRGFGAGATVVFDGGQQLSVVGTLPDALMGAYEMLVTRETGRRIGVATDRYVLFHVQRATKSSPATLSQAFAALLPSDAPYPAVEVRAPGEATNLRANDRAIPPLLLKKTFGEFNGHPGVGSKLVIDPPWVQDNIRSVTLPVLGTVTCNDTIIPLLKQAVRGLTKSQATGTIDDVGDCFAPTIAPDDPSGQLSAAAWGASIQLNPSSNPPGAAANQPKDLVHQMYRWGFGWGGNDAYPQGALFRYRKAPAPKD